MLLKLLLALYPRAWRERYGEEFLAMVEPGRLRASQVLDILAGAVDARLSRDVRQTTMMAPVAVKGGRSMSLKALIACERKRLAFTTGDALIGAGIMVLISLLCTGLGVAAARAGFLLTGGMLKAIAFPGAMMLSMPFWLMKGQPWKVQLAVVGGTLSMLILIGYLSPVR